MPTPNPYSSPQTPPTEAPAFQPARSARFLHLLMVAIAGIAIGSYVSAELLYWHYPDEVRTMGRVLKNTQQALMSSPFTMSLGLIPTVGFFRSHGFLAIVGALLAIYGALIYYRHPSLLTLTIPFSGFVLWSHNNYLSFEALMSV